MATRRSQTEENRELFKEFEGTIGELKGIITALEIKIGKKEQDTHAKAKEFSGDHDYWAWKLELRTKVAHLKTQERIYKDRKNYYENIFLPQFEKESTVVNANVAKVEEEARGLIKKDIPPVDKAILQRVLKEFPEEFTKIKDAQEKQEMKNTYYKAITGTMIKIEKASKAAKKGGGKPNKGAIRKLKSK